MSTNNYHERHEDEQHVNSLITWSMRLGVNAALHPIEYSKVLIQLGYEPIAPKPGKTIFGQPTLILPNIFQYACHIRKVDGFFGCYRGLTPKLIGIIVSSLSSEKLADRMGLAKIVDSKDDPELSDDEQFWRFTMQLKRDLVLHVSAIIISNPFNVISLRMMGQFIGRETKYSSWTSSIVTIYKEEGVFGFFSGLVPKLICDISGLILASTTTYYVNKYIIQEPEVKRIFATFAQFVSSSLFYSLQVVATCMAVTGSGILAGKPPQMPIFQSWRECWHYLNTVGELKRGSSLFWRYYRPSPFSKNVMTSSYVPFPELANYK